MTDIQTKDMGNQLLELLHNFRYRLANKKQYKFGRTIAIIIGDYSVQMAVVRHFWNKSHVLNINKVYIPSTIGTAEKRQDFITGELNRFIQEYGRRSTRYILGIGGQESVIRILTLPKMPHRELSRAIFWEGDKQIPFGLRESYYGHYVTDNANSENNSILRVALLAVSKKEISHRLNQLKVGIRLDAIHNELEAIGHLLRYIDGFSEEKTCTLINIKKHFTEISFFRGDRLEFKHISSTGSDLLLPTHRDHRTLEEFAEVLATEIQNSLDYYVAQFFRSATDKAYLYGDLTYSDEFTASLSDRFGIEFRRFPLENWLKTQPYAADFADQIPSVLQAVAIASAREKMINFLPDDLKEKSAVIRFTRKMVPAMAVLATIILSYWGLLSYQVGAQRLRLESTRQQVMQYEQSPSFIMCNQLKERISANKTLLEQLKQEPTILSLNLKGLSLLTPSTIQLDLYDLQNDGNKYNLLLSGRVISSGNPPEVMLAEYIARLENSPFFGKVNLKRYAKKAQGSEFVLEFQMEMETRI
jgi:Tfp pilus assembly PilM family ATPase